MSDEYAKALERHDAAYQIMKVAIAEYRKRAITDEEFCEAYQAMRLEDAVFDVAFAKAAGH